MMGLQLRWFFKVCGEKLQFCSFKYAVYICVFIRRTKIKIDIDLDDVPSVTSI